MLKETYSYTWTNQNFTDAQQELLAKYLQKAGKIARGTSWQDAVAREFDGSWLSVLDQVYILAKTLGKRLDEPYLDDPTYYFKKFLIREDLPRLDDDEYISFIEGYLEETGSEFQFPALTEDEINNYFDGMSPWEILEKVQGTNINLDAEFFFVHPVWNDIEFITKADLITRFKNDYEAGAIDDYAYNDTPQVSVKFGKYLRFLDYSSEIVMMARYAVNKFFRNLIVKKETPSEDSEEEK